MRPHARTDVIWPLIVVILVLSLAGCGSSSTATGVQSTATAPTAATTATSKSTSTSPPASNPQSRFIVQADTICHRLNVEILADRAKGASAAEIKRLVPRTTALERTAIASLEKLHAPPSLARDWGRLLGYRRMLAGELSQLLRDTESKNSAAVKTVAAAKKRTHTGLTKVAIASGFKDCAKVGAVG